MPSGPELAIIVFVIVLLFGARKLPELAGSVGQSLKEFRKATREADEDSEETTSTTSDDT